MENLDKSKTTKTISIFIPTLEGGGVEKSVIHLANGFAKRGFLVDLLLRKKGGHLESLLSENVNLIDFHVASLKFTLPKLIRYLKVQNPSVLISSLELPNFISIISRLFVKNGPKLFIRIENILSKKEPIYSRFIDKFLWKVSFPHADRIIAISQFCANDAVNYLGLPKEKVSVIYNPVINENLQKMIREPIKYDWFPSESRIIVSIGRLEPVKDHKTLINAFRILERNFSDLKLIIIGEGSLRQELLDQIAEYDLQTKVILPGFLDNPYNILAKANAFVLSSKHEGLANVIIEALACNCPVVSTDCGGPAEVLDFGRYGRIVPVGDYFSIAESIKDTLNGDRRLPPPDWFLQFDTETSVSKYLDLI